MPGVVFSLFPVCVDLTFKLHMYVILESSWQTHTLQGWTLTVYFAKCQM